MTKLEPTDLIAIEVPKDVLKYKVETLEADEDYDELTVLICDTLDYFQLAKGNYEILGEVTANEISFDVESYVGKTKHYTWGGFGYAKTEDVYLDYVLIDVAICRDKNDSFYSLLHSNGLYFENLIEKPLYEIEYYDKSHLEFKRYENDILKWQEAESKVIKGKILILKPI